MANVTILEALDKFNEESNRINDDIIKSLVSNAELPPFIYHYTNDVGLRGILKTGKFWLTDIFALNDPSELEHGVSHFIKALDDKIANGHPEGKSIAECFKIFMGKKELFASFFVCSFSSDGNDLGQWRAYADNGRGFAIGFDTKNFEDAFMQDVTSSQGNATFSVIYNDRQLAEIQRGLVKRLFNLNPFPRMEDLDKNAFFNKLLFPLIHNSLHPALYFKHGAYINEQEYRFLQMHSIVPPPVVNYRSRHYSLIKYREFDWRSLAAKALKKIVIGPSADKPKVLQFARDCLKEADIDPVELVESEIPYRAL
jgi:Protein of unknown function (DUF2971)